MESPAWGPLWQRACAVAFVFGGWAESQGSHPSVGRLEKHSEVLQPPFPLTSCVEWNSKLPTSNLYFFSTSGVGGDGTRECPRRRTLAKGGPSLCSSPFLYNISAPLSLCLSLCRYFGIGASICEREGAHSEEGQPDRKRRTGTLDSSIACRSTLLSDERSRQRRRI
ncbi:hypothetical protein B296_00039793 [Ensete ventricosum]|uniref:Secreted protein n=1 Tax=Ensete ventricosum TaxID=4639 RepID=A0A426Y7A0_ENSVE|nr:hypothetical protein B296_00039793 [Ensete ventricosum]